MQDAGHIVTIASLAGLSGINRLVDYCSSKFAAVGFDESLRTELAVRIVFSLNLYSPLDLDLCVNLNPSFILRWMAAKESRPRSSALTLSRHLFLLESSPSKNQFENIFFVFVLI